MKKEIDGSALGYDHSRTCAYDSNKAVFEWVTPLHEARICLCQDHCNQLYRIGPFEFMSDMCEKCKMEPAMLSRPFCTNCEIENLLEHHTWCHKCAKKECLNIPLLVKMGEMDAEYGEEIKKDLWGPEPECTCGRDGCEKCFKKCAKCCKYNIFSHYDDVDLCEDCEHLESKCEKCGNMCYRDIGGVYWKCRDCLILEHGMCTVTGCKNPAEGTPSVVVLEMDGKDMDRIGEKLDETHANAKRNLCAMCSISGISD